MTKKNIVNGCKSGQLMCRFNVVAFADVVVGDFFFQFFLLSLWASKNVPRVTQMQFGGILHHL